VTRQRLITSMLMGGLGVESMTWKSVPDYAVKQLVSMLEGL
jgi:hypothetical protein